MSQAEASDITSSCSANAGRTTPAPEASSSVAGDGFVTASSASILTSSLGGEYMTAGMSEEQIQTAIETSKVQGWSELKQRSNDDAAPSEHAEENRVIWEQLKNQYPLVFIEDMDLKLGRRIAEGGQAYIYEAKIHYLNLGDFADYDCVAKVFKMEGFSLADLQRQWPLAAKKPLNERLKFSSQGRRNFVEGGVVFGEILSYCGLIHFGTFLEDGRFAFVMSKYWGDLRTLINVKMKDSNYEGPPFSHSDTKLIMIRIAGGVKELHDRGVLHKDLKAANVLVKLAQESGEITEVDVADFESAMLVQGTGFWRAPEVLEELQKRPCNRNLGIWTEKVDAYSFAMTYYEVLTGHVPFDGYEKRDWERVIDGERPHLPEYVNDKTRALLERCWHKEPAKRPTFEDIKTELRNIHIGA